MRAQSLYIIFTQFDPYTLEYLRLFDTFNINQTTAKIIGFKNCCTDWIALPPIEKIDVVLFSENHFTTRDEQMLQSIITQKDQVYLTLRQNAKLALKRELEEKLLTIVQHKLCLPIKEEKHTSGEAFDFLCQVGETYLYNKVAYRNTIRDFHKQFQLDIALEAKLFLMHHPTILKNEEKILTTNSIGLPLQNHLQTLLNRPDIQELLQQKETSYFSNIQLLALQQLLFKRTL